MKYEYKDSGIGLIGLIPKHWKIKRIKDLFEDQGGNGFPIDFQGNEEGELPFLKASDINHKGDIVNQAVNYVSKESAEKMGWRVIPSQSILTAKVGEAMKKNHRKINLSDCLIDNNLMALIIKNQWECEIGFFNRFFKNMDFAEFEKPGAIPSMNMKVFRHFYIAFPPKKEQIAIACYLDKACADIDRVVEIKRRQMENLKEQLKSIVHHTVTKGMNPKAEMKESGEEWIGKRPSHWKQDRLKDLVELRNEKTDEKSEIEDYLELEDLEKETGRILGFRSTDEVTSKVTVFKKHDVLFGKLRPYLNKHYLAKEDGKCTGEILAFNCTKILNRYFEYCISSHGFIETCTIISYGAKMPRVDYTTQLAYFYLPKPPAIEQIKICDTLDIIRDRTLVAQSKIEKQIETLLTYKKSLIHEVVTGKKQVYGLEKEKLQMV